jgi:hypothetical protein
MVFLLIPDLFLLFLADMGFDGMIMSRSVAIFDAPDLPQPLRPLPVYSSN